MRLQLRIAFAVGFVGLQALSLPAYGLPAATKPQTFRAGEQPPKTPSIKPAQIRPAQIKPARLKLAVRAQPNNQKLTARDNGADRLISRPVTEPLARPRNGWPVLVREARKYMGTNPTGRTKLWCATFMNLVLRKSGYAGTNSDAARSFAQYGHRISSPQVGAIAVLARGKINGHVGVVTGIDPNGNPIIISGNHGHRVGEGTYPSSRVIAYVMPSESRPLPQIAERSSPASRSPKPSQPQSASSSVMDSPITELIAAIEAEQVRGDSRPQPPAQAVPQPMAQASSSGDVQVARPADVQAARASEPPHRNVQQMPEQVTPRANPVVVPIPQRLPRPQHPGRVAAAEPVYVNSR
jgi:uncharacterized protein (TIGR02594 family)